MTVPAVPFFLSQAVAEFGAAPEFMSTILSAAGVPAPQFCSALAGKSNNPSATATAAVGSANSTSGGGTVQGISQVTASGGAGGYSYSFAYVSGDNSATVTPSGNTCTFSHSFAKGVQYSNQATWQCTVTDANGHTATVQFVVSLTVTNNA